MLAALWIMAAKCEMEDRNSSESARHLFLRALRFHPENKKVYQEVRKHWHYIQLIKHSIITDVHIVKLLICVCAQYFRMELMHAEKLRKQQQELEQAKIDLVGFIDVDMSPF